MNSKNQGQDATRNAWLKNFIQADGGVSGTVHQRDGGQLNLVAAFQIPPPVLTAIEKIPKGKGMAGLAWERNLAVSTCDLQTDATGDVRPGAKAVGAKAAIALPIGVTEEGPAYVVGIAYMSEVEFSEEKIAELQSSAETVLSLDN